MSTSADIFSHDQVDTRKAIPLEEYLDAYESDAVFKLNTHGLMLRALGNVSEINTALDERLGRIFSNRVIRISPELADLYGIEDSVHRIIDYLRDGAAGFPAERMLLYIHGPPSSGKSTIVSRLLKLFERVPIHTLAIKVKGEGDEIKYERSPFLEHPLGLFDDLEHGARLERDYKIPCGRLQTVMSPWAANHLEKLGTRAAFYVQRVMPCGATSTGIACADFSNGKDPYFLTGRPGKTFTHSDYIPMGAFNRTTQGLLELIELFKINDPNILLPLMTATQDRWYVGAGGMGRLPYQGLPIAYSNTDDWTSFKEQENVSALVSRIFEVKVPMPTSVTADARILQECVARSGSRGMPVVPGTYEVIATLPVASRLKTDNRELRLRLYDGQNLGDLKKEVGRHGDDKDKRQLTADDYRKDANFAEGMEGILIRQVQAWLPLLADSDPYGRHETSGMDKKNGKASSASEADPTKIELGLDPVSVIKKLVSITEQERINVFGDKKVGDTTARNLIERHCVPAAQRAVSLLVRRAYPDDYNWYLRDKFGRYFTMLDHWEAGKDYLDPDSKREYTREEQAQVMASMLERPMGVPSPVDFRRAVWEKVLPYEGDFLVRNATPWRGLDPDVWRRIEETLLPGRDEMLPTDEELKKDKNKKRFSIASTYRETKSERDLYDQYIKRFIALCTDVQKGTSCTPVQARRMIMWFVNEFRTSDLM